MAIDQDFDLVPGILQHGFIKLEVLRHIIIYADYHIIYFKTRFFSRRIFHHITYPDFTFDPIQSQTGIGIIKGIPKMGIGSQIEYLFIVIQNDIKAA